MLCGYLYFQTFTFANREWNKNVNPAKFMQKREFSILK